MYPVLDWIFGTGLQRIPHSLPHKLTILRMDNAAYAFRIEPFRRRKAKNSSRFVRKPNLVARNVPSPQGEVDRIGCDLHGLLRFAQCRLTYFQFTREMRRSKDIATKLIAHHRQQGKNCEADEKWDRDNSPDHEQRLAYGNQAEKDQTATDT